MYYIWTDESDTTGKYYANFYGGILIRSEHLEEVLARLSAVVKEQGLENEEIKWQKVNDYTENRYKNVIDVLFVLIIHSHQDMAVASRLQYRNNDTYY